MYLPNILEPEYTLISLFWPYYRKFILYDGMEFENIEKTEAICSAKFLKQKTKSLRTARIFAVCAALLIDKEKEGCRQTRQPKTDKDNLPYVKALEGHNWITPNKTHTQCDESAGRQEHWEHLALHVVNRYNRRRLGLQNSGDHKRNSTADRRRLWIRLRHGKPKVFQEKKIVLQV